MSQTAKPARCDECGNTFYGMGRCECDKPSRRKLLAALRAITDAEGLAEWQDEQGGCNFGCASTGRLHQEQHAADCPLIVARELVALADREGV